MKKLQNLKGANVLNKKEQQTIQGGYPPECYEDSECASTCFCDLTKALCMSINNPNERCGLWG